MIKNKELKPCPFCGNKNIVVLDAHSGNQVFYYVYCGLLNNGCGVQTLSFLSEKEAIKAWNTRKEQL